MEHRRTGAQAHRRRRSLLGVIFIAVSTLFFGCQQEDIKNSDARDLRSTPSLSTFSLSQADTAFHWEPSYSRMSDIVYQHMKHYRLRYQMEDYLLTDSIAEIIFYLKDSLNEVFNAVGLEDMLSHLENEGVITTQLRVSLTDLLGGLDNAIDPMAYLEAQ